MKTLARVAWLSLAALLAGCGTHQQSALDPAGPDAARVERLWWWMLWILTAIFALVVGWIAAAVRRRGRAPRPEREACDPEQDRRMSRLVLILVALTVLFEFGFLVASAMTMKAQRGLESKNPLEVHVTSYRWWWEFTYVDPVASQTVVTANELHLPVGTPVLFKGTSADVIHSFWVPNVSGKRDHIPGYRTSDWMQVDKEGAYRGQCAEYCGHQHAHMAFYLIAESQEEFQQWLAHQRKPAAEPQEELARRGRDVFLKSPCVTCHTIRGTDAAARVGPDLTHVASRSHIAAGTLPNTRENLKRWIRDSQSVKPGNQMPPVGLSDEELEAVVTYLQTLK